MVFALCGGDERTARLAGLLLADGHGVKVWALEDAPQPDGVLPCLSAAQCRDGAEVRGASHAGSVEARISERAVFRAGCTALVSCSHRWSQIRLFARAQLRANWLNWLRHAAYTCATTGRWKVYRDVNSLATAEGTIGVLLSETTEVLCGKRAVIIGMGHITSQLAPKLAALGMM